MGENSLIIVIIFTYFWSLNYFSKFLQIDTLRLKYYFKSL